MRETLERRYAANVKFHGVATDMATVWPTVGLLVMPSRSEGLPFSALEAQAAGVPVLGARVGGLAAAVHDGVTGWLFNPGNLAEAVKLVSDWKGLAQADQLFLRRACVAHITNAFSPDSELPKVLAVYEQAQRRSNGIAARIVRALRT